MTIPAILSSLIVGVTAAELIYRLIEVGWHRVILRITRRSLMTMRSPRISDHWKERALKIYALRLAWTNLKFSGALLLIFAVVGIMLVPYILLGGDPAGLFLSWTGATLITAVSLMHIILRKRFARH